MRLLILGGTVFLGRHLVANALDRGHEVTLFNRGRSGPELFPDVERLRGDRNHDLSALHGGTWDGVVDTGAFTPTAIRKVLDALAGRVGNYTFVSSISAYETYSADDHEDAPLHSIAEKQLREADALDVGTRATGIEYGQLYGPLKAACERAAEDGLPGRTLVIRPGLIVGPWDYSDRFGWWVRRVARGGEILAPGRPGRRVQMIDVRDLADWILSRIEAGAIGTWNAAGAPTTMGEVLETCTDVSGSDGDFTWVDEDFLLTHDVGPWIELPLWLPESHNGFFEVPSDKALAAGLVFRPLAATVADVLAWDRAEHPAPEWPTGLDPRKEAELLARYRSESEQDS